MLQNQIKIKTTFNNSDFNSPVVIRPSQKSVRLKIIESSSSNPPTPIKKIGGFPGASAYQEATSQFDSEFDHFIKTTPGVADSSFQALGVTFAPLSPVHDNTCSSREPLVSPSERRQSPIKSASPSDLSYLRHLKGDYANLIRL